MVQFSGSTSLSLGYWLPHRLDGVFRGDSQTANSNSLNIDIDHSDTILDSIVIVNIRRLNLKSKGFALALVCLLFQASEAHTYQGWGIP